MGEKEDVLDPDLIEIRMATWWAWLLLVMMVVIFALSVLLLVNRDDSLGLGLGLMGGSLLLGAVFVALIKNPPITASLTSTHFKVGKKEIPLEEILHAEMFAARRGGNLQHNLGLYLTEGGKRKHGRSLVAKMSGHDLILDDNLISMGAEKLAQEINRRIMANDPLRQRSSERDLDS